MGYKRKIKLSCFDAGSIFEQQKHQLSSKEFQRKKAVEGVRALLRYIGEDPDREGLVKTPERVIRAWETEWAIGYDKKFVAKETLSILGAEFEDGAEQYNQMITVENIQLHSCCEHHLAPFFGSAIVSYIPNKLHPKILGLSKLARIVNMFSRKLQVQERLTDQIADFIQIHCKPQGVGVVLKCKHMCMCSRGVMQPDSWAISSALRGDYLSDISVRNEFLILTKN